MISPSPDAANQAAPPKTPWLKILLSVLFIGGFAGWLGWYLNHNLEDFRKLWYLPKAYLLPLLALLTLFFWLNAELARQALKAQQIFLKPLESLALNCAAGLGNFITPFRGGMGFRIIYLKKRHNLSLAHYLAQAGVTALLVLVTAALAGLLGILLLKIEKRPIQPLLAGYFILVLLGGALLLISLGRLPLKETWLGGRPAGLVAGWKLISSARGARFHLITLSLSIVLTSAGMNFLAMRAYGIQMSPGAILFYTGGQIHLATLNLPLGSLGIAEAYSIYLGKTLGYTAAQAVMAQGLLRAVTIFGLLAWGGWAFAHLGFRRHSDKSLQSLVLPNISSPGDSGCRAHRDGAKRL